MASIQGLLAAKREKAAAKSWTEKLLQQTQGFQANTALGADAPAPTATSAISATLPLIVFGGLLVGGLYVMSGVTYNKDKTP